ncbi:hypothetical protein NMY22_g3320 [Coprinellus aureogranulatus]|nr:hypothetical protein NMY22_g3320 [Coprinellus aureogranulatus]
MYLTHDISLFATTFYGESWEVYRCSSMPAGRSRLQFPEAWALTIALDIIPPSSNRLAMPGQYQACIHSLPVTEMSTNHNVQILPGFFSQGIEIPSTDAGGVAQKATHTQSTLLTHTTTAAVEQVPPRFGLIDDSPDRWTTLRARISELNSSPSTRKEGENELGAANEVEPRAECKLILLVRHGEGYHNVAEAKYGTEAWDDYWSKLEGDGELVWGPDPLLTPKGISQARHTREVWEDELQYGLQPPCKIFCSPHSRALKTCEIVFEGYSENGRITVVENCREENGVHTCDKRRPRSFIEANYPQFHIEDSLTEEDELWGPDFRETKAEVAARALGVIERIWEKRPHDWFVAITAHSGFINGVLLALGSKPYPLPTGDKIRLDACKRLGTRGCQLATLSALHRFELTPSTMDPHFEQCALNNHGPLEDELPRIRSLRQQCQATMEAIDEEIERLMMKREAVGRDLKLCDSLLAPIKRVPADILSIIFHMASHIAGYAETPVEAHPNSPNPPQIVPSQVCRSWRRLALNTPTLWSTICITPPAHPLVLDSDDLLGEMLPFAEGPWRNFILKLSTASDGAHGRRHAPETSLPHYAALVELACGVSSRWQTLDLDIATDYPAILSTLIQITPDDVPQLKAIRFQTGSETRLGDLAHYPRGLLAGKALRTLTSVYFDQSVTDMCANWRGLTELRFGVEPGRKKMFGEIRSTIGKELQLRDALTLIHSCPNLRHCEIAVFESPLAGSLGSAEESDRRVRHRHLQSLHFHGYEPSQDLMKSVELPSLRHLELLSSFIGKLTIVDRLLLSSRFLFTINGFGCQLTSIRFNLLLLDNTSVVSQCFLNLHNLLNLELDSSAPTGQASPTRHTISDNFKRVATRFLTLLTRGKDATLPHDPVPFLMPSLLSMRFDGYSFSPKFTPSFIAPRLQELQFHIGSDHQVMGFYDGIIECIHQFGKTTTTLAFSHNFATRPVLVAILDCLSNLETLDLTPATLTGPRSLDERDEGPDQIVLRELNGRSVSAVRCPKLQVLRLWVQDTYPRGTAVEEAVMRFLQERSKAAESGEAAYLQEVDILFHRPIEGDGKDFPGELASRGLYRDGLKLSLRYRG